MSSGRLSRFGDWASLRPLCQVGRFAGSRPFFAGAEANSRMDLVRRAINDIRANWDLYPQFMRELRQFMEDSEPELSGFAEHREWLEELFSSTKEWTANGSDPDIGDYSAIRLYASEYGYQRMFNAINLAFRSDSLTDDPLALRSATFLIELLNIDLYNFRGSNSSADNFEGRVYRGMCIPAESLEMFARVVRAPIAERYLSIPLAMTSASRDKASGLAFAQEQAARAPGTLPLLWDITVCSLDPELLAIYRDAFPASIVTSLCAVPIDLLSDYPDEQEVLLRGPHFQIVRLYNDDAHQGTEPLHVIEAIMLNSNRDHISTIASNTGDDRKARDLFRTMITIHRSAICAERAEACGLSADVETYRATSADARTALESAME